MWLTRKVHTGWLEHEQPIMAMEVEWREVLQAVAEREEIKYLHGVHVSHLDSFREWG